jgi:predicted ribosomally synthesized peptide with nif11-like leader
VAIAKEAGFGVSKTDWLKAQASETLEMSDEELAGVAGGGGQTRPVVNLFAPIID